MKVIRNKEESKLVPFRSLNFWDTFEYLGEICVVVSVGALGASAGARKLTDGAYLNLWDLNPQVKPVNVVCTVEE